MRIVGTEDREQFSVWCDVLRRETSELACVDVESSIAKRVSCLESGLQPSLTVLTSSGMARWGNNLC